MAHAFYSKLFAQPILTPAYKTSERAPVSSLLLFFTYAKTSFIQIRLWRDKVGMGFAFMAVWSACKRHLHLHLPTFALRAIALSHSNLPIIHFITNILRRRWQFYLQNSVSGCVPILRVYERERAALCTLASQESTSLQFEKFASSRAYLSKNDG